MLLDEHRKNPKCDVDREVLIATKKDFLLVCAFQVLGTESDIGGSCDVEAAKQDLQRRKNCSSG